jgi:hypothetical protein
MDQRGLLFEMLLTGFFAVACLRAREMPIPGQRMRFRDLFRFRGRIERMRRSRLQWISILVLLIVARLQWSIPMFVEITFALLLAVFVAIPAPKPIHREC